MYFYNIKVLYKALIGMINCHLLYDFNSEFNKKFEIFDIYIVFVFFFFYIATMPLSFLICRTTIAKI